jgi:phosphoglycolate phosphatase-like HAD superfamily hydrolase
MLILFDIDGTLMDTGGAGLVSLNAAIEEVFGPGGPSLNLAGSTDGGIVRGLFEHFGRPFDPAVEEDFYQAYLPKLESNLSDDSSGGRLLNGASDLLEHCDERGHTTGLLTGNLARGAAIKVGHYGIGDYFGFGAYGDDHWDRNQLGPVALERAQKFTGRNFSVQETLVIGDTPKDIACAHAFGARCLAVATGAFATSELAAAGADQVVESLTECLTSIDLPTLLA